GAVAGKRILLRCDDADVAQAEIAHERIAVGQRLAEMLAGVEEDDRQRAVDAGDQMQQQGRIRAEGGYGGNLPLPMQFQRLRNDFGCRKVAVEGIETLRLGLRLSIGYGCRARSL